MHSLAVSFQLIKMSGLTREVFECVQVLFYSYPSVLSYHFFF